ncbi:MAB_1171c family putative transporter [Streptomyces sp. CB00455]|uniref:MAB_1171c family putative transporter n=1 Tax=Streptomyces sp. CB00455 TaxID=1703927 RepID=UPI00093AE26B|nr:MAB_1171c family putative transporter [Streptomyces sp. CB00455]
MDGSDYYIPAAALALGFLSKLPGLIRRRRNPMVRAVAGLLLMASAGFAFAAPPTIVVVNRIVGMPNISAPLVYTILSVFNTCCIVLLAYWREGLGRDVQRRVRRWVAACGAVSILIAVAFALGDAPVERLRDLDTHYATTPWIREMIVVYLSWHIVVGVVVTTMCWKWSRTVDGWLRAGLLTLVVGFAFSADFGVAKAAAVVARWTGGDLDFLSTDLAPPLAGVGAVLTTAGFLLPQGQRATAAWEAWQTYRRMGPLWRRLRTLAGLPVTTIWWAPLESRLFDRETDIHDDLLALAPYCDAQTMTTCRDRALAEGVSPDDAWAVAAATMIAHAIAAKESAAEMGEESQASGTAALGALLSTGTRGIAHISRQYDALRHHTVAA